jgi:hypothetical protein
LAKSKARKLNKQKPMDAPARAALKRANEKRVKELLRRARANSRMAKSFAKLLGIKPDNVPADLKKQMQSAHRAAFAARAPSLKRLDTLKPSER